MADPYSGRGTTLGAAVESTWGTAVARTNWLRLTEFGLQRKAEYVERPHLGTLSEPPNRRSTYKARETVSGPVGFLMSYDDSTVFLMRYAMGTVNTTGVGPYTHAIDLAEAVTDSLTLEGIRGEKDDGSSTSEVFEGCKAPGFEISIEAGGVATCRLDVTGQTAAARGAAGTPTYSTSNEEILHSHAGQLAWNSNNYDPISVTIRVNNALNSERQLLGSTTIAEQCRTGFMEVMIEAELEYTGNVLHASHHAQDQSDLTLTFTGTGNNALTITGHNAEIMDVDDPIADAGVLRQRVIWRCLSDGTNFGLSLDFTNDNATATAN